MTTDEKLAAILAAVQTDPGGRGLASDPVDNLFTACPGDFAAACRLFADYQGVVNYFTGFPIRNDYGYHSETDGPLGCYFMMCAMCEMHGLPFRKADVHACTDMGDAFKSFEPLTSRGLGELFIDEDLRELSAKPTLSLACEAAGPATDGNYYSMRGRDISEFIRHNDAEHFIRFTNNKPRKRVSVAIGDGGNEIGMGKIPHETIVKNIPNGDLIHCRVPADYLIVAGVSNWGAYALAAGVFVLRGVTPPSDLFDPDIERRILEIMVKAGPLVDGVTGEQTATVDGLTWDEYVKPMIAMRKILGLD